MTDWASNSKCLLRIYQGWVHKKLMLRQILNLFGIFLSLTEVAGEGEPDLAPQNFLLSQQFRHLMRCKKCINKICSAYEL